MPFRDDDWQGVPLFWGKQLGSTEELVGAKRTRRSQARPRRPPLGLDRGARPSASAIASAFNRRVKGRCDGDGGGAHRHHLMKLCSLTVFARRQKISRPNNPVADLPRNPLKTRTKHSFLGSLQNFTHRFFRGGVIMGIP